MTTPYDFLNAGHIGRFPLRALPKVIHSMISTLSMEGRNEVATIILRFVRHELENEYIDEMKRSEPSQSRIESLRAEVNQISEVLK
jgi:hypothetical protein